MCVRRKHLSEEIAEGARDTSIVSKVHFSALFVPQELRSLLEHERLKREKLEATIVELRKQVTTDNSPRLISLSSL